jgi:hypothetical protein
VDAERADNSRVITIIAGTEKAKIELPRILTCTMSPVIADMMQKALKQQQKKLGVLEQVPRFKDGLAVKDDKNILDFASRGQARLRNPTLFLHNASPAAMKALAHWFSDPQASLLSDGEFRRMLLFDSTEKHNDNCGCGRVDLRTSGTLSPSIYCPGHDPTAAISLISFAEEFQMTKLQYEVTKGLLINCGIDQFVEQQVELPRFPHSITFQRCIADKNNLRNAIQYFRLIIRKEAAEQGITELTGGECGVFGLRKGSLEETGPSVERNVSFWGSFEIYFDFWPSDVPHVSQESLVGRVKRTVLG